MKKIGANDPCPCGSGKKFKKCCRDLPFVGFREVEKRLTAQHHQISEQQGLGRKIISCLAGENRVIAVGNKVFLSKKWQTFHDFLFSYVLDLFGRDWLEKENSKPYEERHPFIEWYRLAVEDRNSASKNTNNKIFTLSPSGAGQAFLRLSYGLYLLAHNLEIQNILLKRLKNKDKFIGTFHEISVTSAFIVAGFSIEIENKENSSVSHCEFNAFYPLTNERFSIEVKARELGKTSVRDLLYKALKKEVKYFRVIFIALTLEDMKDDKLQETYNEVIACENGLTINGNNTPPAYVFVYNNQYLAKLKDKDSKNAGFMVGYKIDDLKRNSFFKNLRDGFKSIQKHKAMFQVFEEIKIGARIPSTFDGEIPEFAFNPELQKGRLIIGNKYKMDDGSIGILEDAIVNLSDKKATCIYNISGKRWIAQVPLSDLELAAYNRHPETFFGVKTKVQREIKDAIGFFEWFYDVYKNTPTENLLEFSVQYPQIEQIKKMSREEILLHLCEMYAWWAMSQ